MQEDFGFQAGPASATANAADDTSFEDLVERYYQPLYQFAFSLTHSEADACDLTQHTFHTWQRKGQQLRDPSKVRSWLFTTLHRAFLQGKRREARFPHFELEQVDAELPFVVGETASSLDLADARAALCQIDEVFRTPLALFYLEDFPYREIARILGVPLGTVKSRIARGIAQLKALLKVADQRYPAAA